MAVFQDSKYESDDGEIHFIRLKQETITAAGGAATGDITSDVKAKVSKSNGEFGIRPRYVRGSRVVGSGDTAYREYVKVPVLTVSAWEGAGFALGASISVDGQSYNIISRVNEDY